MIAAFRKTMLAVAIGVAAILLVTPAHPVDAASTDATDAASAKIAVVNETPLYRQDLDREMKMLTLKMARQGRAVGQEQLKRYEGNLRENLIQRTLLLQQAETEGIKVNSSTVDKTFDKFKSGFKNQKDLESALTSMGYTEAPFKEMIRDNLVIRTLIDDKIARNVVVSDKQIRAYYDDNPDLFLRPEQVKASHILIKVPENAAEEKKAAALASIQALKQRIDKGEAFADLAMEYSDCPSKSKGGDLGFFTRKQMVKPFSDAAFAMQPGQVSDVVTTRFGYHLIRVTERKEAETMAFNEVKEGISNRLRQQQEEKKLGDYIKRIKNGADIQRFPM